MTADSTSSRPRAARASLPVRLGRGAARRLAERTAQSFGYTLVTKRFWGPVPAVDELPPYLWREPSTMPGVELDPLRSLSFLRDELAAYAAEFTPPRQPDETAGAFYLDNGTYGPVDAEILYAMVRRFRPRRVVELGSGASTLVIAAAGARNASDGAPLRHSVFDPFPGSIAACGPDEVRRAAEVHPIGANDVPLSTFDELEADDVLFVDTTHTVKTGGDVNYVVLEVLPRLATGVVVHFHDIFLPWEYPKDWLETFRCYWAEQYLLHAFMTFNDAYEVLFAAHAVARAHPDELGRLVPSFSSVELTGISEEPRQGPRAQLAAAVDRVRHPPRPTVSPAAFWLRRTS